MWPSNRRRLLGAGGGPKCDCCDGLTKKVEGTRARPILRIENPLTAMNSIKKVDSRWGHLDLSNKQTALGHEKRANHIKEAIRFGNCAGTNGK